MSRSSTARLASARAVALAATLLLPATALADGLAVQLALRTQAGGPVPDGSYGLVVSLYEDATGTKAAYTQSIAAAPVSAGIAAIVVGEGPGAAPFEALDVAGKAGWLGATVDPSADPCTLAEKGLVGLSSGGDIWYCSGQLWRRVASCAQVCPAAETQSCGDDLVDDCGDVCGKGTLCPQGASCENGGCVYPLGTAENPAISCKAILDAGDAAGSGLYTLDPDGPNAGAAPFEALCDMALDGGGWTVFFVGKNGSPHKFAEFESDAVKCPNAETQCLRRVPAAVTTATTFAATCGEDAVSFNLGAAGVALFKSGSKSQWQPLSNVQALTPDVSQAPDALWTGQSSNNSWILTKEGAGTFSSSYNENNGWDGCDGSPNTGAPIKLMYR